MELLVGYIVPDHADEDSHGNANRGVPYAGVDEDSHGNVNRGVPYAGADEDSHGNANKGRAYTGVDTTALGNSWRRDIQFSPDEVPGTSNGAPSAQWDRSQCRFLC